MSLGKYWEIFNIPMSAFWSLSFFVLPLVRRGFPLLKV